MGSATLTMMLLILYPAVCLFQTSTTGTLNIPYPISMMDAKGGHMFIGAIGPSNMTYFYFFDGVSMITSQIPTFIIKDALWLYTLATNTITTGSYITYSDSQNIIHIYSPNTASYINITGGTYKIQGVYPNPFYFIANYTNFSLIITLKNAKWLQSIRNITNFITVKLQATTTAAYLLGTNNTGHYGLFIASFISFGLDLFIPNPDQELPLFGLCGTFFYLGFRFQIQIRTFANQSTVAASFSFGWRVLEISCVGTDQIAVYSQDGLITLYNVTSATQIQQITAPFASVGLYKFEYPYYGLWVVSGNQVIIYGSAAQVAPPPIVNPIIIPTDLTSTNQSASVLGPWTNQTSEIFGNVMAFTSMKVILKFVVPFTIFLEEIFLYSYHHNITYPLVMSQCMEQISLMNIIKQKPQFMNRFNFNTSIAKSRALDIKYTQYSSLMKNERSGLFNTNIFFLESNLSYFSSGLMTNVLVFLCYLLLKFVVKQLKNKLPESKVLDSIWRALSARTRFWIFFYTYLDSSFTQLCFHCFNQLSLPFYFGWESRLNILATVIILFIVMMYALVGYVMARRFSYRAALNLIVFSKNSRKSFILQGCIYSLSRLLRGLCHSNIFYSHMAKIEMVLGLECTLIVCIIALRKYFINKTAFISHLLYYLGFLCLDVMILKESSYIRLPLTSKQTSTGIGFIIFIILGITLIKVIVSLARSATELKDEFKLIQNSNSIKPESTCKESTRSPTQEKSKTNFSDQQSKIEFVSIMKKSLKKKQKREDNVMLKSCRFVPEDSVLSCSPNYMIVKDCGKKETELDLQKFDMNWSKSSKAKSSKGKSNGIKVTVRKSQFDELKAEQRKKKSPKKAKK